MVIRSYFTSLSGSIEGVPDYQRVWGVLELGQSPRIIFFENMVNAGKCFGVAAFSPFFGYGRIYKDI